MPNFAFTARDTNGNPSNGTIAAASEAEVTQLLRREGKYPTSIRFADAPQTSAGSPGGSGGIKLSRGDVVQLSNQLAIMVETGVTLTEALDCIAQQTEKPKVKAVVDDLVRCVQSGTDLSTALSRHERSFPRLYVALIRASEKSGMLGKLLARATAYIRDEQDTVRRVKGALIYPGVMLGFAVTTTIFLLAFVLPKFTAIYSSKGAALPLPTKILMNMSDFLVNHYVMIPVGVVAAVIGGMFYKRTEQGGRVFDYIALNIPMLGPLFRKLHVSRSIRMIGTMIGAGVPLTDAVATANDLCGNVYFRELWSDVLQKIQVGRQLWEPLAESKLVPGAVTQMIHSGEKSGKLAHVMDQISGFAESELKEQIAELTRYIEPLMIMIMGLIIGGVALALLLPIFTISRVVAS
jgi:type IV pilus assembly protein PilC